MPQASNVVQEENSLGFGSSGDQKAPGRQGKMEVILYLMLGSGRKVMEMDRETLPNVIVPRKLQGCYSTTEVILRGCYSLMLFFQRFSRFPSYLLEFSFNQNCRY